MTFLETTGSAKGTLTAFITALTLYILLDLTWVGLISQDFYQGQIGSLLREFVRWDAVGIFYLLYAVGVVVFCVVPVSKEKKWLEATARGAVLGAIAYGTYNLTNLATLEGWTYTMAVVDIGWGILATSILASVALLSKRFIASTL